MATTKKTAVLKITSKKDGFRRAGVSHPAREVEYPADKFSAEQIAQLEAEPMLIVERGESTEKSDSGK